MKKKEVHWYSVAPGRYANTTLWHATREDREEVVLLNDHMNESDVSMKTPDGHIVNAVLRVDYKKGHSPLSLHFKFHGVDAVFNIENDKSGVLISFEKTKKFHAFYKREVWLQPIIVPVSDKCKTVEEAIALDMIGELEDATFGGSFYYKDLSETNADPAMAYDYMKYDSGTIEVSSNNEKHEIHDAAISFVVHSKAELVKMSDVEEAIEVVRLRIAKDKTK